MDTFRLLLFDILDSVLTWHHSKCKRFGSFMRYVSMATRSDWSETMFLFFDFLIFVPNLHFKSILISEHKSAEYLALDIV